MMLKRVSSRMDLKSVVTYVIFVVVIGLDALLTPNFFSGFVINTTFTNALPLLLVAVGQFFVVITSGIDLSVGGIVSIVNVYVAVHLSRGILSTAEVVGLSMILGLLAGLINGILVAYARIQPILVTLSTLSIYSGVALLILPAPGGNVPPGFAAFLTGQVLGVPVALWVVLLLILFWLWLVHTPLWSQMVAVGSDEVAARLNGVKVELLKVLAYMASGLLSALGGLYLAAQIASGDPTSGSEFVILSIAAVAIGGIALSGGRGTLIGALLGGLIVSVLNTLLFFAGVPTYYQNLIQGALLLITVGIISYRSLRLRILRGQL